MLRSPLPFLLGAWLLSALFALSAEAAPKRVRLEIRVIEATPGAGPQKVDPRLFALAKDLRAFPFKSYALKDAHQKVMSPGERVSFEFPGKGPKERFLVATFHGEQADGKLRFQLTIRDLKFDTLVAVPDGGTLLVGGPRHGQNTIFFAVTAKKSIAAERAKRR